MSAGIVFHNFDPITPKDLPPSDSLLYLGQTKLTFECLLDLLP